MIEIEVDISETLNELIAMKERLDNAAPLMGMIAEEIVSAVEDNFEAEGRPKWPELKKSTIAQRERQRNWPGPILQGKSPRLLNSITSYHDKDTAIVGSNLKYAAIHHFGGEINHPGGTKFFINKEGDFIPLKKDAKRFMGKTKAHKISIPARPFLQMTDKEEQRIYKIAKDYLKGE